MIQRLELALRTLSSDEVAAEISLRRDRLGNVSNQARVALKIENAFDAVLWILTLLEQGLSCALLSAKSTPEEWEQQQNQIHATHLVTDNLEVRELGLAPSSPRSGEPKSDFILFTSGSSGMPKAVSLRKEALRFSAERHRRWFGLSADDTWGLCLPLHHMGGLSVVLRAYFLEQPLYLFRSGRSEEIAEECRAKDLQGLSIVPTQLLGLIEREDFREIFSRPSWKAILVGGAGLGIGLERYLRALGFEVPVFTSYGMSEASSQIATSRAADDLGSRLNEHHLIGSVDVKIAGDGEVLLRGPALFSGYLEGGHVVPLTSEWFATGDIGALHGERLEILGRKKDLVISGGVNILPTEVDRVGGTFPGVHTFQSLGVSDDYWGQRLVAFYNTLDGKKPSESAWKEHFKARLEPAKVPKEFRFLEKFPLLENGKIDRRRLLELAELKIDL